MKKIISILFYFIGAIIMLLSLVMMVIELRSIISLDFMIYDSPINGFIRYFLRFSLAFSYLFMVLCEIIKKLKNNNFIKENLLIFNLSLLIASIIIYFTTTNYINIIVLILMIAYISIKLLIKLLK